MASKKHKNISRRFAQLMGCTAFLRPVLAIPVLCSFITVSVPALAQSLTSNVSVKQVRDKGFKTDNWLFIPSVVSGLKHDNNLFKAQQGAIDDIIAFSAPKIVALKRFKSGEISVEFEALFARYLFNEELSSEDLTGSIEGSFQITPRSVFSFTTSLSRTNELASNINNDTSGAVAENAPIASVELDVSTQILTTFKRFTHSLKFGYSNTDFEDVGTTDQDIRNNEKYTVSTEVGYVVSRHLSLTASAFSDTTFNEFNPDRDVTEFGYSAGFTIAFTSKLSAAFNFGMTKDEFHNQPDSDWQPSLEGSIEWKPREYLTVSVNASQDESSTNFEESSNVITKTSVGGEVSYDVTKKFSVKASTSYSESDIAAENRTLEDRDFELSAQYAINSAMGVVVSYSHDSRETSNNIGEFERDTVQGTFVAKF